MTGNGAFPGDVAIDEIYNRMRDRGMKQKDLAKRLGVSERHISMIFTNNADPSFELARRMWREVMW